jgi:hypothetical protein
MYHLMAPWAKTCCDTQLCRLQPPAHTGSLFEDFSTLKMEAIRPQNVGSHKITLCHIPEDGILQLLGLVASHNRLRGAVSIVFFCLWIYQCSRNMCLFINDNTCGSCMIGHHLFFSTLSAPEHDFGEQWIGCRGPVNWLSWSSDFNIL